MSIVRGLPSVLVTGGLGYIGSHVCVELLNQGYFVHIVDNLSNSRKDVLERIKKAAGSDLVSLNVLDIRNHDALEEIISGINVSSVLHFAGCKAVSESVHNPIKYYDNNVNGTISLLKAMDRHSIKNLIFSSSATVYGSSPDLPYTESSPLCAINPYGRTKQHIEGLLSDWYSSEPKKSVSILRYFNPIGAHESGLIGDDPRGIPNNLLPFIVQVAAKIRPILHVFGNDYPTADGTCIRDYIHIVDLALGHIKALTRNVNNPGLHVYNLGTGEGHSVLEVVETFIKVNDIEVPYQIVDRRDGDHAACYAGTEKAENELGWTTTHSLDDMCRDSWHWYKKSIKEA